LVISHDRYFLDRVVDRIVELDEGTLTEYPGDYTYFAREKARQPQG
jgi:ATPase subunit of ABC transporter with duplicated ATPase domains